MDTSRFNALEVYVDNVLTEMAALPLLCVRTTRMRKMIGYKNDKIISFDTGMIISYTDIGKQAFVVESYNVQPDDGLLCKSKQFLNLNPRLFGFC